MIFFNAIQILFNVFFFIAHNYLMTSFLAFRLWESFGTFLFWATLVLTISIGYIPVFLHRRATEVFSHNTISNLKAKKVEFDMRVKTYERKLEEIIKYTRYLQRFRRIKINLLREDYVPQTYADRQMMEKVVKYLSKRGRYNNTKKQRSHSKDNIRDYIDQINHEVLNLKDKDTQKILEIIDKNNDDLEKMSEREFTRTALKQFNENIYNAVENEMKNFENENSINSKRLNKLKNEYESSASEDDEIVIKNKKPKNNLQDNIVYNPRKKIAETRIKSSNNIINIDEITRDVRNVSFNIKNLNISKNVNYNGNSGKFKKQGLRYNNDDREYYKSTSKPHAMHTNGYFKLDNPNKIHTNDYSNAVSITDNCEDKHRTHSYDNMLRLNYNQEKKRFKTKEKKKVEETEIKKSKIMNNIKVIKPDDDSISDDELIVKSNQVIKHKSSSGKYKEDVKKAYDNEVDMIQNYSNKVEYEVPIQTLNNEKNIFKNEKYTNNETIIEESLLVDKNETRRNIYGFETNQFINNFHPNAIINDIPQELLDNLNNLEIEESKEEEKETQKGTAYEDNLFYQKKNDIDETNLDNATQFSHYQV